MDPEQRTLSSLEAVQAGMVLHKAGRLQEAEGFYRRGLEANPHNADALHYLGVLAYQSGENEDSIELLDRALALGPENAEALNNRGLALHALGRYDDSISGYDKALAVRPGFAEALYNRGNALQELGRYTEALASYDGALAIVPGYVAALGNRGNALQKLQRHVEALASYDAALAIDSGFAEAFSNRGHALQMLNRYDAALASFEKALSLKPDYADAYLNRGLCRLFIGDFERGWRDFEWRWETRQHSAQKRNFSQPLWLGGESLEGRIILLHAEQGLGDTLQFCRYAPLVAARGATVVLEVQGALKQLLVGLQGVHHLLARGEPLPAFDYHCPLLSLPLAFGTTLETIPATTPYIHANPGLVRHWRERLGRRRGLRIGLVWSATKETSYGLARSIELSEFVKLIPDGVQCVSLQKDLSDSERALVEGRTDIIHFGVDFANTAALMELMDIVVSVDTALGTLAGAMGKEEWHLLLFGGDWRWLADREHSPWYPTMRLFRQPAIGEWTSVLRRVRSELERLAAT